MTHHCAYCGKPFAPPPAAPGKRFCCNHHRSRFHAEEAVRALRLLRQTESQQSTEGAASPSSQPEGD